ncbi:MAG: adenylate/guanylate cyclase domain-containing protein [Desulfobacterales bacterium]|nr:adenylate/guanylate cyclase domain-containing protein [Desulfobacterales bacterium]
MDESSLKRKLVAIFSADVAEYSRLMGDDEEDTVRTLTRYRKIMYELIGKHNGRVVDSPGDNLLAEFNSVVDSLRCAWAVQKELTSRNDQLAENRQMKFRIGINLGDIIEKEGRLYGDGVNIAARLESLAEPAGINISGTAYDQVKRKLPYRFHFVGEQKVKNITDPVRVCQAKMSPQETIIGIDRETEKRRVPKARWLFMLVIVGILLVVVGFYLREGMHGRSSIDQTATSVITDRRASQGASIAVLPFKNLSGDDEQEYFSDGITNDIITDLSRFRQLLVIASNSVFTYKGKTVNIKEVGKQLDVRYILEGSVQKIGDSVRINAQLIDAVDETHIWAERYNRDYKEIFNLQGEIVQSIVVALAVNVSQAERTRAMRKEPQDLEAYDYLLQGWAHYYRRTRASSFLASEMFAKAAELDPQYAAAYVGLGWVEYSKVGYGWTEFPQRALESAFVYGRKAVEIDSASALAHALLCNVYTFQNQYELAIREAEQALELNPNDAYTYGQMGWTLLWAGRLDDAVASLEMSLRLDNTSVRNAWLHLGTAFYLKENYEQALEILEKGVVKRPDYVGYYIVLAATYAQLGRTPEAASAVQTVRRLDPFFEVESFGTAFRESAHRVAIADGLRKAGL